jgi:hypothetical protein
MECSELRAYPNREVPLSAFALSGIGRKVKRSLCLLQKMHMQNGHLEDKSESFKLKRKHV